jgi:F-box/leucine-rich repeat protein 10/11
MSAKIYDRTFYLFRLCWYVGDKYLRDLKSKEEFPPRVLESLQALSRFLVSEARAMERGTEAAKREAKENVPSDRVKDAPAMARELRWRVRLAAGAMSDDEDSGRPIQKNMVNGHKRKRSPGGASAGVQFRNFQPKGWDVVNELPRESGERIVNVHPPDTTDRWEQDWTDWKEEFEDGDAREQAAVEKSRDVIIKVRKTDSGVERQRIERVMEKWVWKIMSVNPEQDPQDVEMKTTDDKFLGSECLIQMTKEEEAEGSAPLETQAMEVMTA